MGNFKITLEDLVKEASMRSWKPRGPNRLVKIIEPKTVASDPNYVRATGYVTQEKYIIGKIPLEIENELGLQPNTLLRGAKIYGLSRLPSFKEFEFKFDTTMPDGKLFNIHDIPPVYDFDKHWPPGRGAPQWQISIQIPLTLIMYLMPNQQYIGG